MTDEQLKSEVEFLRQECDRLRKERDVSRKERDDLEQASESDSSIRLKLLSESLSQEIKERFIGNLKNTLWVATLLIGIATAGGLWKLSDIVTARIEEKIKEKEQDVAQVRQTIIKSVVDFEREAKKSLDEIEKLRTRVARESDLASGEIRKAKDRILAFEVSSEGGKVKFSTGAPEGSGVAVWFGLVTGNITAVAGSKADQYGADDTSTNSGAFSSRFQRALLDPRADTNQDGKISIAEAVAATAIALKKDNFNQTPTVAGQGDKIALFSSDKDVYGIEKYKSVHAVVVGINKYQITGSNLRGAVNDAEGFINLLGNKKRALFSSSNITMLLDEKATTKNIRKAVDDLCRKSSKDDLIVFYFSGHVASIIDGEKAAKVLFATDGNIERQSFIKISDVVEMMSQAGAKNALVVVDG